MATKKTATRKTAAKKVTAKKSKVEAKAAQQQRAVLESVNENIDNAQAFAKKVWFAGLGAFGRSYDEVQDRVTQANEDLQARYEKITKEREKLIKELVKRGEKVQVEAEELVKENRANIEDQIESAKTRLSKLVSVVDIPARLQEMSDKLEGLSKDLKKSA